MLEEDDESNW